MRYRIISLVLTVLICTACTAPAPASAPTTGPTSVPTATPLSAEAAIQATMAAMPTQPTLVPLPTLTMAPTPTDAELAELAAQIDKTLTNLTEKDKFSGTVLVMRGDRVVLRKGYGYADHATRTLNTPETVYRIGRLTQPFTVAAIMLLESQGKLSVKDPICEYVDNCPAAWEPITLHHLLSNSSGIASYTDIGDFEQISNTPVTPDALIELVRDMPLLFAPEKRWHESESNYVLLGMVIERVSGQPYETFLQEQIFAPLQMTATGYAAQPDGLASGYKSYNQWVPADSIDVSVGYSAFGLYSTVDDLYRWDRAFFADTLLSREQREVMLTAYTHPYGLGAGYGTYFWNEWGHHLVLHGLDWQMYPGYESRNWSWTDIDMHVVVLSNVEQGMEDYMPVIAPVMLGFWE